MRARHQKHLFYVCVLVDQVCDVVDVLETGLTHDHPDFRSRPELVVDGLERLLEALRVVANVQDCVYILKSNFLEPARLRHPEQEFLKLRRLHFFIAGNDSKHF